jgi:hypothetical protein
MVAGAVVAFPAFLDWMNLIVTGGVVGPDRGLSDEVAPTFMRFIVGTAMLGVGQFLWKTAAKHRPATQHTVTYAFQGPVGIVGHNVDARGARVDQTQTIELGALAKDLEELREAMAEVADTVDKQNAVGQIAMAEQSARNGEGPRAESHLRTAGNWALDVAKKIGVPLAVAALKRTLGLP